jgi:hypothetical protein
MSGPNYPASRTVAITVQEYFARHLAAARNKPQPLAPQPDAADVELIINTTFWASLRKEEGYSPKISLAFLPPEASAQPMMFDHPLELTPSVLSRMAPAVERPGIHLGVWRTGGPDKLRIWGITRSIPKLCFVLEVIEPGLLVVKYRRSQETGKYVNVVVLKGDEIKVVDEQGTSLPDCPALVTALLGFGAPGSNGDTLNVLVQLAASMRAHGRGGSLLVVPQNSDKWRASIIQHVPYTVAPPYSELAALMKVNGEERSTQLWQESFIDAVDAIAGLTAVDGAALIINKLRS